MYLSLTRNKINSNTVFIFYFIFCLGFAVVLICFISVLTLELPMGMASRLIIKPINKALNCYLIVATSITVPRAIQYHRIRSNRNVTPDFPSKVVKNKNAYVEDLSIDTVVMGGLC